MKVKKSNQAKYDLFCELYVNTNMTLNELSDKVGISPNTAASWRDGSNLDDLKEAQTITRKTLLQDAYRQLAAVNVEIRDKHNDVPPKTLADAKKQLREEITTLSDNPLHIYTEVFSEFTDWLYKNRPKQVKDFAASSLEFLQQKADSNK